jgi:hypothetical protein
LDGVHVGLLSLWTRPATDDAMEQGG